MTAVISHESMAISRINPLEEFAAYAKLYTNKSFANGRRCRQNLKKMVS